jgi:hypothetical protein
VNGQLHAPAALYPQRNTRGKHWIAGWMSPRTGMDDVEKRKISPLKELELWPFGLLTRSQSLYRLRAALLNIYLKQLMAKWSRQLPAEIKIEKETYALKLVCIFCDQQISQGENIN